MEKKVVWTLDPSYCPLCGKENACKMAAGVDPSGCWCGEVSFPEALLDLVPEAAKRKACICKDCVDEWHRDRGQFLKKIGQNP